MPHAHLDPAERDLLLQRYLDGDLPGADATRLFLAAEEDAELAAELERWRGLYGLLDADPRQEPSPGFDSRVLARIPYERFRTAPRKALPALVLGEAAPAAVGRLLRSAGRGAVAACLAWVLFVVVSHSFLQRAVGEVARTVGDQLARGASASAEIPVLSALVGAVAWAYDALVSLVASLGHAVGGATVTITAGLVLGAIFLVAFSAGRRRQEAKRTHA